MTRRIIPEPRVQRGMKAVGLSESEGISGESLPDDYLTKLMKYIPGEIVAAFLAINGFLISVKSPNIYMIWGIFIVLIIFTVLYTKYITDERDKPVAKTQIVISTIAFIIWVFTIGGPFAYYGWYEPYYGSILLVFFTLGVPLISIRE